jgi:hypothetical protein
MQVGSHWKAWRIIWHRIFSLPIFSPHPHMEACTAQASIHLLLCIKPSSRLIKTAESAVVKLIYKPPSKNWIFHTKVVFIIGQSSSKRRLAHYCTRLPFTLSTFQRGHLALHLIKAPWLSSIIRVSYWGPCSSPCPYLDTKDAFPWDHGHATPPHTEFSNNRESSDHHHRNLKWAPIKPTNGNGYSNQKKPQLKSDLGPTHGLGDGLQLYCNISWSIKRVNCSC